MVVGWVVQGSKTRSSPSYARYHLSNRCLKSSISIPVPPAPLVATVC